MANNLKSLSQPYPGTVADFLDVLFPVRTTAQLEDIGDDINTKDKYVGKRVWNSTTGLPVFADAATPGGTWSAATGIATHTPV